MPNLKKGISTASRQERNSKKNQCTIADRPLGWIFSGPFYLSSFCPLPPFAPSLSPGVMTHLMCWSPAFSHWPCDHKARPAWTWSVHRSQSALLQKPGRSGTTEGDSESQRWRRGGDQWHGKREKIEKTTMVESFNTRRPHSLYRKWTSTCVNQSQVYVLFYMAISLNMVWTWYLKDMVGFQGLLWRLTSFSVPLFVTHTNTHTLTHKLPFSLPPSVSHRWCVRARSILGVSSTDRMAGQETLWKGGESEAMEMCSILTANIIIDSFLWGAVLWSQARLAGGNLNIPEKNFKNLNFFRIGEKQSGENTFLTWFSWVWETGL